MPGTYRRKSKSERGDTLTLRLPAKVKFSIELLAQKQGTTLSAIVMNAVEQPLRGVGTGLTVLNDQGERVYLPDLVWDPLEPDRHVKLAIHAPDLLTDRQKVLWKVIQENQKYWQDNQPNYKAIRDNWEAIQEETNNQLEQFGQ